MTILIEEKVYSMLIQSHSMFLNSIELKGFAHMEEIIGRNCKVIELPKGILFWYSEDEVSKYEHTVTLRYNNENVHLFGSIIMNSNDNNLSGMKSLSFEQLLWLKENSFMEKSIYHKNYILNFDIQTDSLEGGQ